MSGAHGPTVKEAVGRSVPPAWFVERGTSFRNALGRTHGKMVPPFVLALERLFGIVDNKMLAIAVELNIPDLLHEGPRSAAQLAATTGADADALERMLRFLVSRDLLGTTKDGSFKNNAVSDVLRADHPWSWRGWVSFFGSDWNWKIWNEAKHSVMTGESGALAAFGHDFFEHVNHRDPKAGEAFNEAMEAGSRIQGVVLEDSYDFSRYRRVCDVGGGTGAVLGAILQANENLEGTLFELPEVAEAARLKVQAAGLLDRCSVVGGDFFASVPGNCDLYLMLAVLHDWDDAPAAAILRNVRAAMPADGKAVVVESVLTDDPGYSFARATDLLMLVLTGSGRERSEEDFKKLFGAAGFATRVIKLPTLFRAFELTPA
jgi:hypothetical protein